MKLLKTAVIFVLLVLVFAEPVLGIDTFQGGAPRISASISGTNEYSPGQEANITILVLNSGVNTDKFVMTGTIDRQDNAGRDRWGIPASAVGQLHVSCSIHPACSRYPPVAVPAGEPDNPAYNKD